MVATIANYPDKPTVYYAELWSTDSFAIVANDWWPHASLVSENKGDERDIGGGVRYKIDVPARCWVFWEGTSDGRRVLQVQRAADGHPLDNPPGVGFLPIEPRVNVISFGAEPEPPEEPEPGPPTPEPEPEPPAEMPSPRSITIYGGGGGLATPRCGCQRYGSGDGEWSALICEVEPKRFQAFLDAWQELVDASTR